MIVNTSFIYRFLHMTLQRNLPSFEAVVKIVDAMNMNHLLNLPNDLHQTILHMACAAERPSIVTLLIEKGNMKYVSSIDNFFLSSLCKKRVYQLLNQKDVNY